ncbi:PEPxxWA-CTERM sorting domain-containing protein [Kordiimonas sp. SCSIO 12610]|uniref:PEPxxWA-CTERM sorting domain-containing protein n=1 Tax=Kordiimonas sp. SCSIO 12610 TaxID=2829597 RepID=UPI00210BC7FB|nr:PEPxxWA-CTERM sorting domain-containing protein [Kordiimonas sp. SCSIO 12610]UTW56186.1 PEP-CTERM sorting domain-containing protein [Kordiimonas sp. SCSIO 12610]
MKKLIFAALLSVFSLGSVHGQTTTFTFTGDAFFDTNEEMALFGASSTFEAFTAELIFDNNQSLADAFDVSSDPARDISNYNFISLAISVGSVNYTVNSGRVTIIDGTVSAPPLAGDQLAFGGSTNIALSEFSTIRASNFSFSGSAIDVFSGIGANVFNAGNINSLDGSPFGSGGIIYLTRDSSGSIIGGDILEFGNIQLSSVVTAVPEPATWLMMIVGFALTGFALRRRERGQKAAA